MEFSSHGIPAGRRIGYIERSTLTNRFHGNRALARLQASAKKISGHEAVSFSAHQFRGRSVAPEVCAIHAKERPCCLAEKTDQSWGWHSVGSCIRESQEQFLESIIRARDGFLQHRRISGMLSQKGTAFSSTKPQVIEYTGKIDCYLNLSQGNNVWSVQL